MGAAHPVTGPSVNHGGAHRGPAVVVDQWVEGRLRRLDPDPLQLLRQDSGLHGQLVPGVDVEQVAATAALQAMGARHGHTDG